MYEKLLELDHIVLSFSPEGLHIMNITIAFIMFGVALDIKVGDFKKIAYNPKSTILGVISQFLLLPAITFLLAFLFRGYITPTVALGMILVAACPGGNVSNFISSLAKGNVALSVTLTAFATIMAVILTPLNFSFWGKLYTTSSQFVRPLEIDISQVFETVLLILGIPLLAGIAFSHYLPKITEKIKKPIKNFSILIFTAFIVVAFANNFDYFTKYIKYIFLIVLIHNFVALFTGFSLATVFKTPNSDRRTITIETGIQNSGLALVLIFNPKIFPPELEIGGMAFVAAWWGIWHILAGLTMAFIWKRKPVKEAEI